MKWIALLTAALLAAVAMSFGNAGSARASAVPEPGGAIVLDRWNVCNPPPYDCSPSGTARNDHEIFYDCSCHIDGESEPYPGYAHYERTSETFGWASASGCLIPRFHIDRWGSSHLGEPVPHFLDACCDASKCTCPADGAVPVCRPY